MFKLYPITVFRYRLQDEHMDSTKHPKYYLKYSVYENMFIHSDSTLPSSIGDYNSVRHDTLVVLQGVRNAVEMADFDSPEEAVDYLNNLILMV